MLALFLPHKTLLISLSAMTAALVAKVFNKSWESSLACLAACRLIGIVMVRLSPTVTLPVALAGGISATVAELLPIPVDDNLTIPLFSAGTMALVALYFG